MFRKQTIVSSRFICVLIGAAVFLWSTYFRYTRGLNQSHVHIKLSDADSPDDYTVSIRSIFNSESDLLHTGNIWTTYPTRPPVAEIFVSGPDKPDPDSIEIRFGFSWQDFFRSDHASELVPIPELHPTKWKVVLPEHRRSFLSRFSAMVNWQGDAWLLLQPFLAGLLAATLSFILLAAINSVGDSESTARPRLLSTFFVTFAVGCVATAVIAAIAVSLGVRFETNDDPIHRAILSGQMGNGEPYPITNYHSIISGLVVAACYSRWPLTDWYCWSQLISLCLAGGCQHLASRLLLSRTRSAFVFIVLASLCYFYFLMKYQFTQVAIVCSASGLGLITTAVRQCHGSVRLAGVLLGTGVTLLGASHRYDGFFLAFVLFCPLFVAMFLESRKNGVQLFCACAIIVACVFSMRFVDTCIYTSIGLHESIRFDRAKSLLKDRKRLCDERVASAAYQNCGFEEYELASFDSWLFYDSRAVTIEMLECVGHAIHSTVSFREKVGHLRFALIRDLWDREWTLVFLTGGVVWLVTFGSKLSRASLAVVAAELVVAISVIAALYTFRKLPDRVFLPIEYCVLWHATLATCMFTTQRIRISGLRLVAWKTLAGLILIAIFSMKFIDFEELHASNQNYSPDVSAELSNVLEAKGAKLALTTRYGLLSTKPFQQPFFAAGRLVPVTSFCRGPLFERTCKYDVSRSAEALLEGQPQIHVVGDDPEIILLKEMVVRNLGESVRVVEHGEVAGVKIVTFSRELQGPQR